MNSQYKYFNNEYKFYHYENIFYASLENSFEIFFKIPFNKHQHILLQNLKSKHKNLKTFCQ